MPFDASIILGSQPQQPRSPMDSYARALQIRSFEDQQRDRALDREAAQFDLYQKKKQAEQDDRVRALFRRPTPPTPEEIVAEAGPEKGHAILKGITALQVENQNLYKNTAELLRDVAMGMDALPEDVRAQQWTGVRGNLLGRRLIKPDDMPERYDRAYWETVRRYGTGQQVQNVNGYFIDTATRQVVGEAPQPKITPYQQAEIDARKAEADRAARQRSAELAETRRYHDLSMSGNTPADRRADERRKDAATRWKANELKTLEWRIINGVPQYESGVLVGKMKMTPEQIQGEKLRIQNGYEDQLGLPQSSTLGPEWNEQPPPAAAAPAPKQPAQAPAPAQTPPQTRQASSYTVGQEVTYQGKRYRIKAIEKGEAVLEEIR